MENACESLYNTENACDIIDTEKKQIKIAYREWI